MTWYEINLNEYSHSAKYVVDISFYQMSCNVNLTHLKMFDADEDEEETSQLTTRGAVLQPPLAPPLSLISPGM